MLNNKGFDLWADGYDKTVGISDEENTYPFAGYKKVLGFIFQTIMQAGNAVVLDIGFGTGTLTAKLYERGCSIYGQDFSSRMIALASEKMPNAHLYQGDFSKGLVEPLRSFRYDYIVATYAQKTGAELLLLPYKSPEHTYKLNLYTQFGPPQLKYSFLNYHNKIPTCAGHQQKQYIY